LFSFFYFSFFLYLFSVVWAGAGHCWRMHGRADGPLLCLCVRMPPVSGGAGMVLGRKRPDHRGVVLSQRRQLPQWLRRHLLLIDCVHNHERLLANTRMFIDYHQKEEKKKKQTNNY
jgi:hypothetical protein